MIAAISWVPKGASKSVPTVAEPPSKKEIEEMLKSLVMEICADSENAEDDEDMEVDALKQDEVAHALAAASTLGCTNLETDSIEDALKELDMDHYDEEDDGVDMFGSGLGNLYYPSNDLDPYLKDNDDDDSEEEEPIKPEDIVLVCTRHKNSGSGHKNWLEVLILETTKDGSSNMRLHHDIIISKTPLCTAWLDCPLKGGEKGNFIAVGTMDPAIEIWDLDIMNELEPSLVLGGIREKKKKGKKNIIEFATGSHTDSVLGLAWNKEYRNILASGSADKTVKIWDAATGQCNITMEHHTDKVQAVAWNPFASQVLLSGSFDHSVVMKDGRIPSHSGFKWSVTACVESLAWDPHTEHSFVVSLENGMVTSFDIRTASSDPKPSFTLHAHDKAVCAVSYNSLVPNLLATGSMDKTVKL